MDFQTGGWQINGSGSTLTIGAGGLTSTSTTGGTNTINSNITLGGSQTWTTSAGNTVVVNGAMTFGASTLTKNGLGTLTLGTTGQSTTYSAGSALDVSGGTLNLQSSGGDNTHRYLAVAVNNATLGVGATQYLASLTMTNSARASISLATAGTASSTIKTDALSIDSTSLLDLRDNNLIVNYTGGGTAALAAVESLVKSGAGTKSDGAHWDWNGTSGITTFVGHPDEHRQPVPVAGHPGLRLQPGQPAGPGDAGRRGDRVEYQRRDRRRSPSSTRGWATWTWTAR